MVKALYIYIVALFLAFSPLRVPADVSSHEHSIAKSSIQYLLAVDRLHFYIQNLADNLENKSDSSVVTALRSISPEDIIKEKYELQKLSNISEWQGIVFDLAVNKTSKVQFAELEWNYNFFKNKLLGRFIIKEHKPSKEAKPLLDSNRDGSVLRSIPKISGQKYLLDVERYIAEKTSRAIVWDAIANDRDFEFHIGTLRDFNERIERNNIQIISEIQPMARNYNKIYLTYHPETGRYAYAINMISGDDRIKHLIAQLRLITFNGKSYLREGRDKVRVFGNALDFHKEQQEKLLDIYQRLPKADKVIIGQKGAIDDAIRAAGMLEVISENYTLVRDTLALESSKKSKFESLVNKAQEISNFSLEAIQSSPVKLDVAYEQTQDPFQRIYRQFNSEQASHEFSDYLLLDANNEIKRWRVISAVWGDEIIPIAEALKKSGHKDIVYIGTAGAIAGKGIKVGDVVTGGVVQTHSGKNLNFSEGNLNVGGKSVTVGQVYTPFNETDTWLSKKGPSMDIVEVETGYLREILGEQTKLQAYFLISDIVGSESETLAHAAQSSSKRKKGQIRLLENLFIKNGIKGPISNLEMLPSNARLKNTFKQLALLRPSRDTFSLLQIAFVAVREGKFSTAELESLLKQQPNFERVHVDFALTTLGSLLVEIQSKIARTQKVGFISESISSGTFNPKSRTAVQIFVDGLTDKEVRSLIGDSRLQKFQMALKNSFEISFVSSGETTNNLGTRLRALDSDDLFKIYEDQILKNVSFAAEQDMSGRYRLKEMPGLDGVVRCQEVFR